MRADWWIKSRRKTIAMEIVRLKRELARLEWEDAQLAEEGRPALPPPPEGGGR